MKIVDIFASGYLHSVHYPEEVLHEYDRLMECWRNPEYLESFLLTNSSDIPTNKNIYEVTDEIIEESYDIEELILEILEGDKINLDEFFIQLHNSEYESISLSKRKGKTKYLRLYSIRIDRHLHVITGGAIKLPRQHLMEDRLHTKTELDKLQKTKYYLQENGIIDDDSFFEFQIDYYGDK